MTTQANMPAVAADRSTLFLGIGLGPAGAALLLARVAAGPAPLLVGLRLGLVGVALLAAAQAVVLRPRGAGVLSLAALTAWLTGRALDPAWDTAILLLSVLATVAACAALLVLLPRTVGKVVVSLLILVHFGGILTAVTSVPPPGGPAPWLISQAWTRFYRPYLQFMYLNNAYHFYSPEPGPACLLWFRVAYADGTGRWVHVPDAKRDMKDPLALEYYRRLSLTESTNQLLSVTSIPPALLQRRLVAGQEEGVPSPDQLAPLVTGVPQFRPPNEHSARLIGSYARYVARSYPRSAEQAPVVAVKVYRVVHGIVPPRELVRGLEPTDPTLYFPYYQGEFDPAGQLRDTNDPWLYWLIPIIRIPAGLGHAREGEVWNYLALHAGSSPWEENE